MCKKLALTLLLISLSTLTIFAQSKINIDNGWKFILDDNKSFIDNGFDDSNWRELDLPHDWAFEGGYDIDNPGKHLCGYTVGGIGWYRKTVQFSKKDCIDKRHIIAFDAVYMNSEVWVNGHYLGKRPYGYISFEYEITKYIKDGTNVIAVKVDNTLAASARWYHGCGIYGSVYIKESGKSRFVTDGIFVQTPKITQNNAEVSINWEIDRAEENNNLRADFVIRDKNNKVVVESNRIAIDKNSGQVDLNLPNPLLWDIYKPNLYSLKATIYDGKRVVDVNNITFGVRSIKWDIETGFWINGRNEKIRGMCEHLEGGPIGAAWSRNMMRWKVETLKAMGCNAIRTAHNPQLPMFYEICNEAGMLVLDEAFDGWYRKAEFDYGLQGFGKWANTDLRDFIRRDRNHPSIFLWSVGNETGGNIAKTLVSICHENDSSRLVTASMANLDDMDIFGGNGASEEKWFVESYKTTDKPFIGTEFPHGGNTRGFYRTITEYKYGYPSQSFDPFETPSLTEKEIFQYEWNDVSKKGVTQKRFESSYDNVVHRINNRQTLANLRDKAWFSGMFKWVGFGYYGETPIGCWPFRGHDTGVVDWAGIEKDIYYLYQSQWSDKPMVHILPHWTHPYMEEGTMIPVWVYTNGDEVELLFNGKTLGKKRNGKEWDKMQCEWSVPYSAGKLEAVAYKDGKEFARTEQLTSGAPSQLKITKEESFLENELKDMHIFTIDQTDSQQTLYPYGENRVYFYIEGDAEIYSSENGSPVDVDINYNPKSRRCFFGKSRIFVRNNSKKNAKIYFGAILGDKHLKLSDEISITVDGIDINGKPADLECAIYYTTDGSTPTANSNLYTKPFSVELGTTVKAIAEFRGKTIFVMEDKFGENEGIYWGKVTNFVRPRYIIEAENCNLNGCTVIGENKESVPDRINYAIKALVGKIEQGNEIYPGKTVVGMKQSSSTISFYHENDGAAATIPLKINYIANKVTTANFKVYNNDKLIDTKEIKIDKSGKWFIHTVGLPLSIGGNQIKITIENGEDIVVDSFEFVM